LAGYPAATLVVVPTESPASQLLKQYPVFLAGEVDCLALLLAQSAGD
jgi:hypothetical protein